MLKDPLISTKQLRIGLTHIQEEEGGDFKVFKNPESGSLNDYGAVESIYEKI